MGRLFYVDESADEYHHFHGGVLVEAGGIPTATAVLDEAREKAQRAGYAGVNAPELHAKDIFGSNSPWKHSPSQTRSTWLLTLSARSRPPRAR